MIEEQRTVKDYRHPSNAELLQLIDKENEDFVCSEATRHLRHCETCQRKLDSLAAQPEEWQKARQFLKGSATNDPLTDSHYGESPLSNAKQSQSVATQFSTSELLDPPQHPEMLGRIGDYDIECEVGRGGMGVVFKAYDSKLHRPVAIKVLSPHLAGNGTARKRFAKEAVAAAGIIHPNVIAVHGVSDEGKTPFIIMPFVDGISLQTLVENRGPLDEVAVVRIALQIASGLAAAHSQGLIHRDIKPANILVEAGINRVLITDFGLARAVDDAALTQTGWLTGTPNYMSPEQAQGERPDYRSDLFSLGSLLYYLTTGRLPFRSDTPLGVLARIQNEMPTPTRQVNNEISETLSALIERLLAKQPEDRFQTAAELHEVLQQYLVYLNQPDSTRPPKIYRRQNRKRRKQFVKFGLWSLLVFFVVSNLIYWSFAAGLSKQWNGNSASKTSQRFEDIDDVKLDSAGKLLITNATNFLAMSRYDEAIELYQEATKYPEYAGQAHYNLGCLWAIQGKPDKAFESLSLAVDNGFEQPKLFKTDDDLDSLRRDPRFQELLQRLK